MEMEHREPCTHIFCLYTHTRPLWWGQTANPIFSPEVVILHMKLKGMEHRAPCTRICFLYTHPRPLGWDQRSKHFFTESSHVAYQSKGNGT